MKNAGISLAGLLALVVFLNPLGSAATNGTAGPTHFQAAFSDLVPCHAPSYPGRGGCEASSQKFITNATSVFTWTRELLPYTVPTGKELHITDVVFGSKHVCEDGDCRNSYLTISGFPTITELGPSVSLATPFIIPSGTKIEVSFINNSPEPQWMNGAITGWLVDAVPQSSTPAATATATPVVTATVGAPSPTPMATSSPFSTATKTPMPLATATTAPCPSWAWWC